jgi:hypothetical protein
MISSIAQIVYQRHFVVTRDLRRVAKEHGVEKLCVGSDSATWAYRHIKLHYRIRSVESGHISLSHVELPWRVSQLISLSSSFDMAAGDNSCHTGSLLPETHGFDMGPALTATLVTQTRHKHVDTRLKGHNTSRRRDGQGKKETYRQRKEQRWT